MSAYKQAEKDMIALNTPELHHNKGIVSDIPFFLHTVAVTQCPEMILNKIEKVFNKTYTGLKSFLQRFQICFS